MDSDPLEPLLQTRRLIRSLLLQIHREKLYELQLEIDFLQKCKMKRHIEGCDSCHVDRELQQRLDEKHRILEACF